METLKDAMRPNAHREREKVKATITGMIASLNQKLVAAGKPPVLAPAKTAEDWESAQKYARRVTVPTKVPLDPTELQKINDLCVAEAKALAKFEKIVSEMQILDEEGPAPDVFRHFTAEEQAAMLEAMRKRLHGYEPVHPEYRLLANSLQGYRSSLGDLSKQQTVFEGSTTMPRNALRCQC